MKEAPLEQLRKQFKDSPKILAWMHARFEGQGAESLRQLIEEADASPFPLSQWVEALMVLDHWLLSRGLIADAGDQIGYLSCAAASATASANLEALPALVESMLADFGFERAR